MHTLWVTSLLLVGCQKDKDEETGEETAEETAEDTGGDTTVDSEDTSVPCEVALLSTTPADGATDVYYRDVYSANFSGDAGAALISILDSGGLEIPTEITWSEGNVQATLRADLFASAAYTLHVEVCGVATDVAFSTSSLGTPLDEGNSSLLGRTYVIQLSEADITEPALLDAIASQYLTVPLLFEVTTADETTIEFLGGLGYQDDLGGYHQYEDIPTWAFPAGDFSDTPYFSAAAAYITIMYGDIPIPIEEFTLEGSFTSDGTAIERGRATGKADSRYMSPLIERPEDDYGAFCELATSLGIPCEACADGKPYCLFIIAEDITGLYQPGVDLTVYK